MVSGRRAFWESECDHAKSEQFASWGENMYKILLLKSSVVGCGVASCCRIEAIHNRQYVMRVVGSVSAILPTWLH